MRLFRLGITAIRRISFIKSRSGRLTAIFYLARACGQPQPLLYRIAHGLLLEHLHHGGRPARLIDEIKSGAVHDGHGVSAEVACTICADGHRGADWRPERKPRRRSLVLRAGQAAGGNTGHSRKIRHRVVARLIHSEEKIPGEGRVAVCRSRLRIKYATAGARVSADTERGNVVDWVRQVADRRRSSAAAVNL
jgi:hypothetical protein